MEFLSLSRRRSSAQNVPSSEEGGETDVFTGYLEGHYVFFFGELKHEPKYVETETSARLTVLFLWRKVIIR